MTHPSQHQPAPSQTTPGIPGFPGSPGVSGVSAGGEVGSANPHPEPTLRKRYVFKIFGNVVGLVCSLVTQALIPRALGPGPYGQFNYLYNFFTQLFGFVDGGTSTAFYTKVSQRPNEPGLVRFYWGYVLVTAAIVAIIVAGIFGIGINEWIWVDQEPRFVALGAVMGLFVVVRNSINYMIDAHGLTVSGELARIVQTLVGLLLIVALYAAHRLHLASYFLYNYATMALVCGLWWVVLARRGVAVWPHDRLRREQIRVYTREFYAYAMPLAGAAFVGLFSGLLDYWLLQKVAGDEQQGFFGLAAQIGVICFFFAGAVMQLVVREFSRAAQRGDQEALRKLFSRTVPMFYAIAAYFSVFTAIAAVPVTQLFGGDKFRGAAVAVAIMALYPMCQACNQIYGAMLLAVGHTRLYAAMSVLGFILSPLATFYLVGPVQWHGLDLQANGLAIKMVALNFFNATVLLWMTTRLLRLSAWRIFWHQVYSAGLMAVLAWMAFRGVSSFVSAPLMAFLISGILYTAGVVAVTFAIPMIFGTTRQEIFHTMDVGRRWLRGLMG